MHWTVTGALLTCLWLSGLDRIPLFDVDEGAFAQASREMLASGDWGHTTLNGTDRFDKPILIYWLQVWALKVFGISELAVRLPSALCAVGLAAATGHFVRHRLGMDCARIVPWVLATALGPALIGRAATADALLGLLIALAAFDLWRCIEPQAEAKAQRMALRRSAIWIGLGLLTKGPVALLIPGAAVLLWVLSRPASERRPLLTRLLSDPLAWIGLITVAAPWYAYAIHRHGWAFVDGFLLRHNLERLAGPMEGHSGGPLYYLIALPRLVLPWSVLLVPLLRDLRQLWQNPLTRYLIGWAGFVLVFFSLAGTKLPHYMLYGIVPIAILFSIHLSGEVSRSLVAGVAIGVGLLLTSGLGSPGLAQSLVTAGIDFWQSQLATEGPIWLRAPLPWLLSLVALVLLLRGWRWTRGRATSLIGAALIAQIVWFLTAVPWWSQHLQGPVRTLGKLAADAGVSLVQWRVHQPSVGFYLGGTAPRRAPGPGEAALARADHFDNLDPNQQASFKELGRAGGFVLVQRQ